MKSVLFVCVGNACRSQMAEGFARHLGPPELAVYSAGSRPAGFVAPQAVEAMKEKGISLAGQFSKGVGEVPLEFDVVVTMGCGDSCPTVKAKRKMDWDIPDPIGGPPQFFRKVRDEIEAKVRVLLLSLR